MGNLLNQRLNGSGQACGGIVHLGLGRRLIGSYRSGLFQSIHQGSPGFGGVIALRQGLGHSDGCVQVGPLRNKGGERRLCHPQTSGGMLGHQIRHKLQQEALGQLQHLHLIPADASYRVVVNHGSLVHLIIGGAPSVLERRDVLTGEVAVIVIGEGGKIAAFYGQGHQIGAVRRLLNFDSVLDNGGNLAVVHVLEAKVAEDRIHSIVRSILTAWGNRQISDNGILRHIPDINAYCDVRISHGDRGRILSGEALELRFHAICVHRDEAVFRTLDASGGGSSYLGSFLTLGCGQLHRQGRIGLQGHLGPLPAVEVRHKGFSGCIPCRARLGIEHGLEHVIEGIFSHVYQSRTQDNMLEGRIAGESAPFQSLHAIAQIEGLQCVHAGNPLNAGVVALGKYQMLQGTHEGKRPAGNRLKVVPKGKSFNDCVGEGEGPHCFQGIGQLDLLQTGTAVKGTGAQGFQALLELYCFQSFDIPECKIRNGFHRGRGDKFRHGVLGRAKDQFLPTVPQQHAVHAAEHRIFLRDVNRLQIVGAGKADFSQVRQAGANGNAPDLRRVGECALSHCNQRVGENHNLQIGAPGKGVCSQIHQGVAQIRLDKHTVLERIVSHRLNLVEIQGCEAFAEGERVASDGLHAVRRYQGRDGREGKGVGADLLQLCLRGEAKLLQVGQVRKGVLRHLGDVCRDGINPGGNQLRLRGGMAHQDSSIHTEQDVVHHPEAGISRSDGNTGKAGSGDKGSPQAGDASANGNLLQVGTILQDKVPYLRDAVREGQRGNIGLRECLGADGLQPIVQGNLCNAGSHESAGFDGHKAGRGGKGGNLYTVKGVSTNGFQAGREFQRFQAAGRQCVGSDGLQCTGKVDVFQIATGVNHIIRNLSQALRQDDRVEVIAIIERLATDLPNAVRKPDFCDHRGFKGEITDLVQLAILREGNLIQPLTIGESIISNLRDAGGDENLLHRPHGKDIIVDLCDALRNRNLGTPARILL